jgi:pimeloyl-ACP methyl ester carboxylesterase
MHFEHCGAGDAILFIHGMPTSGRLWRGITDRLQARYTCFTIDLPGLGKSPQEQYGPDYLRLLAERIDGLRAAKGISKWHIVGHDAGSVVAVHYAHYYQQHVGCMALLAPALFPELRPYYLIEPLRKPVLGEFLAPFIRLLFWKVAMQRALAGQEDDGQAVADFYQPFSGVAGPWKFMQVLRWGKPAEILAKVPDFLPNLQMPTLIFHGSNDAAIPELFARRAAVLIPDAKLIILDSGHFIPLRQPEVVAANLAQFFCSHLGQTGTLPIVQA